MANNEVESARGFNRYLQAEAGREIVFCHMCESQWWRDEHGLVCPGCEGEITEIVSAQSDPRPRPRLPTPPEVSNLRQHYPFHPYADDSDPEEADIDEHIRHTPDGYTFSRTTHSQTPLREAQDRRRGMPEDENETDVMGSFQSMIANMMGPHIGQPPQRGQGGQPRSGTHTFSFGTVGGGPNASGATWSFSAGGPDRGYQHFSGEGLPPDFHSMFGGIFGGPPMVPGSHDGDNPYPGMPPALGGLLASLLNPVNARSGDAVYTQEALDNIVSQLMEQNTSNAPGPATDDAINALPKKKLDEKMLGPEGKGECSVCMDDVTVGDEVVQLPCSHWFHQQCASIWLKEHNTCPICRKAIDGSSSEGASTAGSSRGQSQSQSPPLRATVRRLSQINRRPSSAATGSSPTNAGRMESFPMNAAARSADLERRLESIRETPRSRTEGDYTPRTTSIIRIQVVGSGNHAPVVSRRSSRIERPREERRNSERSHGSSSRETRQSTRRSSTQSSANSSNVGGLASSAVGWLRDRLTGKSSSSSSRRRD